MKMLLIKMEYKFESASDGIKNVLAILVTVLTIFILLYHLQTASTYKVKATRKEQELKNIELGN